MLLLAKTSKTRWQFRGKLLPPNSLVFTWGALEEIKVLSKAPLGTEEIREKNRKLRTSFLCTLSMKDESGNSCNRTCHPFKGSEWVVGGSQYINVLANAPRNCAFTKPIPSAFVTWPAEPALCSPRRALYALSTCKVIALLGVGHLLLGVSGSTKLCPQWLPSACACCTSFSQIHPVNWIAFYQNHPVNWQCILMSPHQYTHAAEYFSCTQVEHDTCLQTWVYNFRYQEMTTSAPCVDTHTVKTCTSTSQNRLVTHSSGSEYSCPAATTSQQIVGGTKKTPNCCLRCCT